MQRSKEMDEVCYPFIHEVSPLCDFEVLTDELCGNIGAALSMTSPDMSDIRADLDALQPLAFHLNGSIRGRLAIAESDLDWAKSRLDYYRSAGADQLDGFVLPRGEMPVPFLNLARSGAKKAIRQMVRLEESAIEVPAVLPRFCNILCNLLFAMIVVINQRRSLAETTFTSKSYGANTRKD